MSTDREIDAAREAWDSRYISPADEPEENYNERAIANLHKWVDDNEKLILEEAQRALDARQWGAVVEAAETLADIDAFKDDESLDEYDYESDEFRSQIWYAQE
jgi:hypothetical protein